MQRRDVSWKVNFAWTRMEEESGTEMVNFLRTLQQNKIYMYVSNTHCQHAARHITTWKEYYRDNKSGELKYQFHQLDYILCKLNHKIAIKDSKAFNGIIPNSDHSILISQFRIERKFFPEGYHLIINLILRN